jgi:hypothetical protein
MRKSSIQESSSPNSDTINRLKAAPDKETEQRIEIPPGPADASYDPFDLKNLRIDPSGMVGAVERVALGYSVRKPNPNSFFRVHPDPAYYAEAFLFADKQNKKTRGDIYLVSPAYVPTVHPDCVRRFKPHKLYLVQERHAVDPIVWPIGFALSDEDRDNEYWLTARTAAETAKTKWTRIDTSDARYVSYHPKADFPDPVWTTVPFREILRLAFKDRIINSHEHPVIKGLLGYV